MAPSPDGERWSPGQAAGRGDSKWRRLALVGFLLVLCIFVARTCQQAQIRVTQDEAIATAERQIDFVAQSGRRSGCCGRA